VSGREPSNGVAGIYGIDGPLCRVWQASQSRACSNCKAARRYSGNEYVARQQAAITPLWVEVVLPPSSLAAAAAAQDAGGSNLTYSRTSSCRATWLHQHRVPPPPPLLLLLLLSAPPSLLLLVPQSGPPHLAH
jgi:hypothetical protein